ncbi:hypothetical protein JPSP25_02760 [Staphylococcus pseudintermedius]
MGIGGKALEMIYKHAAKEMNMIKVYGEVYEMNSRCKKMLDKCGFVCEGELKKVKSRLLCKMLYNVFTISTYQN